MKNFIVVLLLSLPLCSRAQDIQNEIVDQEEYKLDYTLKTKMGFSELEINDKDALQGNIFQFDFLHSSRLSNNFRLEYGFGFTEFKANNTVDGQASNIVNNYFRVPVSALYSRNFSSNASLVTGLGIYGNYLIDSEIKNVIDENNVGVSFGVSFNTGVRFKVYDNIDFGLLFEFQSDLSKIKKDEINVTQKLQNTKMVVLNFSYKL